MDFHRGIIGVLVILVILVVSFGELVSLSFGESVSGNGRRLQIQSERGSALVLPLVELKRNGGALDHRFKERRRGLEYEAEWEDARMTLHDDLLTKGDRVMHMFTNILQPVISMTGLQKNAGLSRLSGKGQDGKLYENDGDGYYMWLHSYTSVRYYTSRVFIGSPPQEFALIVDTGSTVTYVPCSTCTHCGHHQDPRFVPDNSSSYQAVACDSQDCITDMCDKNHQCKYERMYAEMSSSKGVLGKDLLGFGPTSRLLPQSLLFGCETAETGDLYLQHADGIMGLGRGPLSIVDQLVGNGVMEDSFSLCYGGMDEGGGSMVLGAIPAPQGMVFAKSDPERSSYYNLDLSEIQVQGVSLELESKVFNGKYGTIIDSGTTYAYLPNGAFEAFRDAIIQQLGSLQAVVGPDPNYPDICYAGAGTDTKELGKHFPPVDFVFAGNKKVFLAPENYLFKHSKVPGAYCLGFFKNVDATTLLGGIVVRNMLVTYDRFNQQIGFFRTNCTDLWSILPAEAPLRPPPAVSPVNEKRSPVESPIAPPLSTPSPALSPEAEQNFVSIELLIALDANITIFSSEITLFISSISSQLAVLPSQISIGEIKEEEGHVVVRCIISAASSNHFTSSSAKALAVKFEEHTVQLPEIFGAYHLRSWKGLPPSKWAWIHSEKIKAGVIITVLVGVVIMLAVVASLAYWYFAKYRNRDQIKYNNLDEVEANEGETLIGDQQL